MEFENSAQHIWAYRVSKTESTGCLAFRSYHVRTEELKHRRRLPMVENPCFLPPYRPNPPSGKTRLATYAPYARASSEIRKNLVDHKIGDACDITNSIAKLVQSHKRISPGKRTTPELLTI